MSSTNGNCEISKKARTEPSVIGTHSGTFHCDEALACFMLRQLPEYENAKIFRSRDDKQLRERSDIIVDVGGEFDHERRYYDHHQKSFQETLSSLRPELGDEFNKIRLSSAGLIYTYYGERVISSLLERHANVTLSPQNLRICFVQIYRNLISEIDAIDNGVPMFGDEKAQPIYKVHTHLSARVGRLNPDWDAPDNFNIDEQFEKAVAMVGEEFLEKVLHTGVSWIKARDIVREALLNRNQVHASGQILLLNNFCPWKAHLSDLEKEFQLEGIPKLVIFQDTSKQWRVAGVPITPDSFVGRKFLPVAWRGLRDAELSKIAGVDDLLFVHHTGFIGGAKTDKAVLQMSIKSLEWPETEGDN